MTFRKITFDNSVRYIPQSEQTKEKDSKPNTILNYSLPKKQKKTFHKTTEKSLKMCQHKYLVSSIE